MADSPLADLADLSPDALVLARQRMESLANPEPEPDYQPVDLPPDIKERILAGIKDKLAAPVTSLRLQVTPGTMQTHIIVTCVAPACTQAIDLVNKAAWPNQRVLKWAKDSGFSKFSDGWRCLDHARAHRQHLQMARDVGR